MKIIYICNEYPPKQSGGIGFFTKLISESLVFEGHKVVVYGYGKDSHETVNIENGVKVIRKPQPKYGRNRLVNSLKVCLDRLRFYKDLNKHAKLFNADIVESYDWSAPLLFKPRQGKLLIRLHGSHTSFYDYAGKKRSRLYFHLEKRALKIADSIVSVSDFIADITKESFDYTFPYKTIYNGVDLTKFKNCGLGRNLNKVLFVGRMHDMKGFIELFKALNRVFERNQTVHIDIVCTVVPQYKARVLKLVDTKYHDRIRFLGRIDNSQLPKKYNESNLLILPSLAEAFPIIPLESMACGTPVIMADRFSSREIIDEGEDGFLVDVLDPEKLASGILEAISDQLKIEGMREKAHQKIANNFGIVRILQENMEHYASLLK